jgi:membrane protein insertase Oxa1/YidC/SpoIIIJ
MIDYITLGSMVMKWISDTTGQIIAFAATTPWLFGITILDWGLLIMFSNIMFRFIRWWFILPKKQNVQKQWRK